MDDARKINQKTNLKLRASRLKFHKVWFWRMNFKIEFYLEFKHRIP